jgi:hypothetical protein
MTNFTDVTTHDVGSSYLPKPKDLRNYTDNDWNKETDDTPF